MKLAQILKANESKEQRQKAHILVLQRLKELVYSFPKEVTAVLHHAGISLGGNLPAGVILAIVNKNLDSNQTLRDNIGKMLLEMDGYDSADGSGWQIAGTTLGALASILSGIGRSQTQAQIINSDSSVKEEELKKENEALQAKNQRNFWLTIGISAIVLIVGIALVNMLSKSKLKTQTT